MGKLNVRYRYRVPASTLVEVLVALVILLTVFGIGMLIFARLNQASTSQSRQQVTFQLRAIGDAYTQGEWDTEQGYAQDHIRYSIEETPINGFEDRRRVQVYAFDSEQQQLTDSLILILPITDEK